MGVLEVRKLHIGFCVIHCLRMKTVLPMNVGGLTCVKCEKETGFVTCGLLFGSSKCQNGFRRVE